MPAVHVSCENPFFATVPLNRQNDSEPVSQSTEEDSIQARFKARLAGIKALCTRKNGIALVPKLLDFEGVNIGSAVTKRLMLQNDSDKLVVLKEISVQKIQTVCQFEAATDQAQESESILAVLEPNGSCIIKVTCNPAQLGRTTDFVILNFGHFEIGSVLRATGLSGETAIVGELKIQPTGIRLPWQQAEDTARAKIVDEKKCKVVRGVNPIRPPFFKAPKQLRRNSVPNYLWKIVGEEDEAELLRKHPCIGQELNIANYIDIFRIALWLEELESIIARRQHDVDDVMMRVVGDYLAFDVPCIKEIRPPIQVGDSISIIDTDGEKKYQAWIYDIRDEEVFTKLSGNGGTLCLEFAVRIEFSLGRTIYKRLHYAVEQAVGFLGEDWLFPKDDFEFKAPRINFTDNDHANSNNQEDQDTDNENIETTQMLVLFRKRSTKAVAQRQRILLGNIKGRTINKRMVSICDKFKSDTRGASERAVKLTWFNKSLNTEQKGAVRGILRGACRPLPYIIFGPPGTGKTVTLVEAVMQVYNLDEHSRTLVVAPSNSAADRIAELMVESGEFMLGDFVRLYGFLRQENQVPEKIRPFSTDGEQLSKIASLRLIISTCLTAGQFHSLNLETGHFTHVFIDEAGYCTEPESLVAASLMALQHSGQLILAGDPLQLGAVLLSQAAQTCGLATSLLERLMKHPIYARNEDTFPVVHYNPACITKLIHNYRSHPILLQLPSKLFYDQELVASAAEGSVTLFKSLDFMNNGSVPLLFHGIQGACRREKTSPSWYNVAEVIQVVLYVRKLNQQGVDNKDIGVITPYRKQVEKLMRALRLEVGSEGLIPKIGSVEEFQGGEQQVIILSLVRSTFRYEDEEDEDERTNDHRTFIYSPKRFNVAVTRAKSVLIVLGNPYILVKDKNWKEFLNFCLEQGCYTGCNLPNCLGECVQATSYAQEVSSSLMSSLDRDGTLAQPSGCTDVSDGRFTNYFTGIMKFSKSVMMATAASVFNAPVLKSRDANYFKSETGSEHAESNSDLD